MHEKLEALLEHHGVKGMHWGVRKMPRSDGSGVSPSFRKRVKNKFNDPEFQRRFIQSKGDTRKRTHYRRSAKSLSDAELHRRIARLNLERQYNDLNDPKSQAKIDRGKKRADGIIKKAGKGAAEDVLKKAFKFGIESNISKHGKGSFAKMLADEAARRAAQAAKVGL